MLVAIVVVALIGVAWMVRAPLPKTHGELTLAGINAPITVRRDRRGIPHIDAASESDLFFAQGFACAQDRLWQLDTLRRQAEGRLSAIAGPTTLATDRYMRMLGFTTAAAADLRRLSGRARADLLAYAAGVNAAMSSRTLPLEFKLMRYTPEPWTPVDSLAIVKLMAQRLDDQWSKPELRSDLRARFGAGVAAALTDTSVPKLEHYIAGYAPKQALALGWAHYRSPVAPDIGSGSNNWSVNGRRTTSGKPVLANDTHLAHSLPSTWWICHLRGAGFDVEGFQVPGIPGVILGHNERIAFGVTSSGEPVQDLFVEHFRSPSSDEYMANGRWLRAHHRHERISVKGEANIDLDVLVTRHGPVIERHGTQALALAWTVLREGGEMQALRDLDRAGDWQQFRAATRNVAGPVLNFVYADIGGDIGYQDVGHVPLRRAGDGTLPVEGQDDRFAWTGDVPFDSLPHVLNPPQGLVATANNNLSPPLVHSAGMTAPGSLTAFADAPYRVHRIYERLAVPQKMTAQQIGSVQADVFDYPHAQLAAATADALTNSSDPLLQLIAGQLKGWDGMASADSRITSFVMAEDSALADRVLRPKLGPSLFERYQHDYHPITPLVRVLQGDGRLARMGITRRTIMEAIPSAAAAAAQRIGADTQHGLANVPAWGDLNAAVYDHPLGRFWPLDALLNARRIPQAGNAFTVFAGRATFGPSMRMALDLADWDNSSMLLTLGESGQYSDPYYADEEEDFLAVHWSPTAFTEHAVANDTKDTLVLRPK